MSDLLANVVFVLLIGVGCLALLVVVIAIRAHFRWPRRDKRPPLVLRRPR